MSNGGYLKWDIQFLLNKYWLDGRWSDFGADSLTSEAADGVIVLDTHAQTQIVQKRYTGSLAPLLGDKWKFTLTLAADSQDDYRSLLLSRARARPVAFVPGKWAVDVFPAGQSAGVLSRPPCSGLAGFPSTDPGGVPLGAADTVQVYLDGNRDDAAATVTGQSVAFAASGEIAVFYMPAFWVVFVPGPKDEISDPNNLKLSFDLEEVRQGNFQ